MKRLFTLVLVLACMSMSHAQDREKKFAISMFSDPNATYVDGFNLGASIEYQMNWVYFKAQTFVFPDLNGVPYVEMVGVPLGFNIQDIWEDYRVYTGLKLGVVNRQGNPYPLAGIEGGVDVDISDDIYFGLMASYDSREDGGIWEEHAESYMRFSGFFRLGYRF